MVESSWKLSQPSSEEFMEEKSPELVLSTVLELAKQAKEQQNAGALAERVMASYSRDRTDSCHSEVIVLDLPIPWCKRLVMVTEEVHAHLNTWALLARMQWMAERPLAALQYLAFGNTTNG